MLVLRLALVALAVTQMNGERRSKYGDYDLIGEGSTEGLGDGPPTPDNPYTRMQVTVYNKEASRWSLGNLDAVVGTFLQHNDWPDHQDFIFGRHAEISPSFPVDTNVFSDSDAIALDFGCGPGRNIVHYRDYFRRIDGADIVQPNLDNARIWYNHNFFGANRPAPGSDEDPILYLTNGVALDTVPSGMYDMVFSMIAMQHIPVYQIRYNLLSEFFRVLKPGGWISIQMGFGFPSIMTVRYYENFWGAQATNRGCDVAIDKWEQVEGDLTSIGFVNAHHWIRPVGPGDGHPNWIYFRAMKPGLRGRMGSGEL